MKKFYTHLVKIDSHNLFNDPLEFDSYEHHDNIGRTISWHDYDVVKDQLAYRILFNNDVIMCLEKMKIKS